MIPYEFLDTLTVIFIIFHSSMFLFLCPPYFKLHDLQIQGQKTGTGSALKASSKSSTITFIVPEGALNDPKWKKQTIVLIRSGTYEPQQQ